MKLRKLKLESVEWHYRIGHSNAVLLSPEGRKAVVDLSELTGRSWHTLERGRWKKTGDGMVTPRDIRAYLQRNPLPNPSARS